jgi:predicted esterase
VSAAGREPEIRELETVRTARYALAGASPREARRIWFVLHGYGQLAPRFATAFASAVPPDTCVVAPEGLSRFYLEAPRADGAHLQRVGATWLTRESRESEIRDAHRWLDRVHAAVMDEVRGPSPPACGVLGFSQGVATAMRWIADGAVRPAAFVAWAGGLATDVDVPRFRAKTGGADVVLVAGDQDRLVSEEALARTLETLRTMHPSPRLVRFAGGHSLEPVTLAALLHDMLSR